MKFFLCLVVLAVVAVHADESEFPKAEASRPLQSILPSKQPLKPKPTLAPYKPIPKVIQTTRVPYGQPKVTPTRKNIVIEPSQPSGYVPWSQSH